MNTDETRSPAAAMPPVSPTAPLTPRLPVKPMKLVKPMKNDRAGRAAGRRRFAAMPAVGIAVLCLAAGLVVSRPLVREWARGLPASPYPAASGEVLPRVGADTLQLYYYLWLVKDSLAGPTPILRDPYQFRFDGPRWNLPATFPPLSVPFTLLSGLGSFRAYNLLVLLSFPLSGLAAYGLVRRYTGSELAGATAAMAFALSPTRLDSLFQGQPAGLAAPLLPLVVWGLEVAITEGRVLGGVVGGAALLSLGTLESHFSYFLAWLVPAYVALRAPALARPVSYRALSAFAVLGAGGFAWQWMLKTALLVDSVASGGQALGELSGPGAAGLLAAGTHGGRLLPLAAMVGLLAPGIGAWPLRLFFGALAAVGAVLSLGPSLPAVPLYETAHRWVPLFGFIRNLPRFRFLTVLGETVLLGYACMAMRRWLPRAVATGAGVAVLLAILVDSAPRHGIAVMRLGDSPVYSRLAAEAGRVLYLPLLPGDSPAAAAQLYHPTRTRLPMLNGYSRGAPLAFETQVLRPLGALNAGELGVAEQAHLGRLGVSHVVLDGALWSTGLFPLAFARDRLASSGGLALEVAAPPLWLFRLTRWVEPVGPAPTSPAGAFYEAEALPRDTGRSVEDQSAAGRHVVLARPGLDRPGRLVAGPSYFLPRGSYRATVRARGDGLTLTARSAEGGELLGERPVPAGPGWSQAEIRFVLDRGQGVDLAVVWDGRGEASVDETLLTFADRPDPEWLFLAVQLHNSLVEEPDPAAPAGHAGCTDETHGTGAVVLRGPTRRFPEGRHRFTVRVRLRGPATGPVLRLLVTQPWGPVVETALVDASSLAVDGYHDIHVTAILPRATVLDLLVVHHGGPGICLDRITVTPEVGAAGGP